MRRQWAFVAVILLTFALAGCGATASIGSSATRGELPTALIVTRTGNPYDHILPLVGGSMDAAAVQRLYRAMYALPHVPSGVVYHCPADFGIVYTFTFINGGTVILKANANATGCEFLTLGSSDSRTTNDAFWSLLAQTANIPPSSIHSAPAP